MELTAGSLGFGLSNSRHTSHTGTLRTIAARGAWLETVFEEQTKLAPWCTMSGCLAAGSRPPVLWSQHIIICKDNVNNVNILSYQVNTPPTCCLEFPPRNQPHTPARNSLHLGLDIQGVPVIVQLSWARKGLTDEQQRCEWQKWCEMVDSCKPARHDQNNSQNHSLHMILQQKYCKNFYMIVASILHYHIALKKHDWSWLYRPIVHPSHNSSVPPHFSFVSKSLSTPWVRLSSPGGAN